jgi:hypothetical protein
MVFIQDMVLNGKNKLVRKQLPTGWPAASYTDQDHHPTLPECITHCYSDLINPGPAETVFL